jgi:hypothetical protein
MRARCTNVRRLLPLFALALSAGNAAAAQPTGHTAAAADPPTRTVIVQAELEKLKAHETAHAAVARLRPFFLRPRSQLGAVPGRGTIAVYVNGQLTGGVEALRAIQVSEIERIELVQPEDMHKLFGGGRGADAVINVTLRRQVIRNP